MMLIRLFITLLVATLLSSCTYQALEQDFEFSNANPNGLLAMLPLANSETTLYFQEVDLERKKFVGKSIKFSFCHFCPPSENIHELKEDGNMFRFRLMPVPPGFYAIVTANVWEILTYKKRRRYTCFSEGTEVLEVKSGKISLVNYHDFSVLDDNAMDDLVIELKKHTVKYSNITAEIGKASPVAVISFETKDGDTRFCSNLFEDKGRFEIVEVYR